MESEEEKKAGESKQAIIIQLFDQMHSIKMDLADAMSPKFICKSLSPY
jgi:hypothetical protein